MQKTYTQIGFLMLFTLAFFSSKTASFAQQDPMFTQYMFNTLSFNPAYAGSKEYLSGTILYRTQWLGWNNSNGLDADVSTGGAPISQTFTLHSPLNNRVGVGLSVVNDKIGLTESTGANISYAYRIGFADGTLSLGLQGGAFNFRSDFSENIIARDNIEDDPAFVLEQSSIWVPNFGGGIYYYTKNFYAGVSVPRLMEFESRKAVVDLDDRTIKISQSYRHIYFTLGGAIPIKGNRNMVFKPSLLIKNVGLLAENSSSNINSIGAPTEFDIDASLLLYQSFWVGLSFRSAFEYFTIQESSNDSIDAWMAFYLKNGLRLGFAYDFSLHPIQNYSVGSFEMSVGYDFNYESEKINSPRYF